MRGTSFEVEPETSIFGLRGYPIELTDQINRFEGRVGDLTSSRGINPGDSHFAGGAGVGGLQVQTGIATRREPDFVV
jgi:hypothetical protein